MEIVQARLSVLTIVKLFNFDTHVHFRREERYSLKQQIDRVRMTVHGINWEFELLMLFSLPY